jgi:hypothetical protein
MLDKYLADSRYMNDGSEKDLWGILYGVASLYAIGYNLARPVPGNWANAISDISNRMDVVLRSITTLSLAITDIYRAISELPPVMNSLIQINAVESELNKARQRNIIIKSLLKNEGSLEANIDDVMRYALDNLLAVGIFDDWYQANPTGKVNYICTIAPILTPTMIAINYAQVKKWEIANHGKKYQNYPFDEILTHKDFYADSLLTRACMEMVQDTEKIAHEHLATSQRVYPFSTTSFNLSGPHRIDETEDVDRNSYATYRYNNGEFIFHDFVQLGSSNELPPSPTYEELFTGKWFVNTTNNTIFSVVTTPEYSDNSYSENACFRFSARSASNPSLLKDAQETAKVIATSQWRMQQIRLIHNNLDGYRSLYNNLLSANVWADATKE